MRRLLLGLACCLATYATAAERCGDWPGWQSFRDHLLVDGGRIVDVSDPRRITTSEGQSYGLFFALVANDRASFDALLAWTEQQLAQGSLSEHLPAWLWGYDGATGRILDDNPATDADLWIAYTLAEAGRLWHQPRYAAMSRLMVRRILKEESVDLPGLGRTLLPAPQGFQPTPDISRLNPSYLPLFVLRRFAALDPASSWPAVLDSAMHVVIDSAAKGFSPDWVRYHTGMGFEPDETSHAVGSYNAIRSYLWAGMVNGSDPYASPLQSALRPMAQATRMRGSPPETIDTRSGTLGDHDGPVGFSAAMLPLLIALRDHDGEAAQQQRIAAQPPAADAYYNQALTLFGLGHAEGRFRFAPDGALIPTWLGCVPSRSR